MQDFETVAVFTYPSEMAIARSFLEAEGIETYVRDELTVQVHNFYSNAIGGIRLEVPVAEIETASSLLQEHGYSQYVVYGVEQTPDDASDTVAQHIGKSAMRIIILALVLLLFIIALFYIFSPH